MPDQSLRSVLAAFEDAGELRRISEPVSLRYELSAMLAASDGGPALLFESVDGVRLPVVGNVLATRERIAAALGTSVAGIQERMLGALAAPVAPIEVAAAPCQEVQVEDPDLARLPVPWFFEHETGPYVTAGAIVAREAGGPIAPRTSRSRGSSRSAARGRWWGSRPTTTWRCSVAARRSGARRCRSRSRSATTPRCCWPRVCTWTSATTSSGTRAGCSANRCGSHARRTAWPFRPSARSCSRAGSTTATWSKRASCRSSTGCTRTTEPVRWSRSSD